MNKRFLNLTAVRGFLLAVLVLGVISCKQNQDDVDPNQTGELVLEFDNIVGDQDLILGTGNYVNAVGEQFSVDMLRYYISNIKLKTDDGREYALPATAENYFLVRENDKNSQLIRLRGVPEGNYSEMSFVIGVDSLRSTMPPSERTGTLDVGNASTGGGMYWSWNSGYIFFRIEGKSPQSSHTKNGEKVYFYHVGGFGGYSSTTVNNIRRKTLTLGNDRAKVRAGRSPQIHIFCDVKKVFSGSSNISFATNPFSHFTAWSSNLANNYVNAFYYDHVHNH